MKKTRGGTYELMDSDQRLLARNYAPQQLAVISQDIRALELINEIDRVLDHRVRDNQEEYLVSWKGYGEQTWVPYKDFQDVAIVRRYHDNQRKEFLEYQRKSKQPQVQRPKATPPPPKRQKSK